jgi:hypothetical protein
MVGLGDGTVGWTKDTLQKKVVNNRFYGHVRVDGVVTFDMNELR